MMSGSWGQSMMGGIGIWGSLFAIVVFVDLVLVGVWLWKQINK